LLENEDNMVEVNDPVVFIGDIHGQFYDLNKMLDLVGRLGELT